jgi:diguanylate cyclase (GGDEF)-like protein
MIVCLSDIVNRDFVKIDAYDGLRKAERIMDEKRLDSLVVLKEGKLAGILTARDICKSHPNRIIADAMTKSVVTAPPETSLWDAKLLFERHMISELLVIDQGELAGIVSDTKLYSELGKHLDQLTGLYRSDYIYYHGIKLLERGVEISVIFIDIDKFGQIDKDHGHVQGDRILKEMSWIIKSHISEDAYLCRFGGDEFVVLAPYRLEKSKAFAESLLKAIANHKFLLGFDVTASIGISGGRRHDARTSGPYEMITGLINLASLASTKAKKERGKLAVADGFCASEIA